MRLSEHFVAQIQYISIETCVYKLSSFNTSQNYLLTKDLATVIIQRFSYCEAHGRESSYSENVSLPLLKTAKIGSAAEFHDNLENRTTLPNFAIKTAKIGSVFRISQCFQNRENWQRLPDITKTLKIGKPVRIS